MLPSNKVITIILLACLMAGCMPSKHVAGFKEADALNLPFFEAIPEIKESNFNRIIVYKINFRERYIESKSTLQFSLLTDSGKQPVKYLTGFGDNQDIYLAAIDIPDNPNDAYVYFSAKYNYKNTCLGFGPAYYGHYDNYKKVIKFDARMHVSKAKNGGYSLKEDNSKEQLIFVCADSIRTPLPKQIRIEKLVLGEYNKVGGKRPVIFDVKELMRDIDLKYFYFNAADTISLN
jgi:hypothetical protein